MRIAPELLAEIVAHAQENARIECCGVVAVAPPDASDASVPPVLAADAPASASAEQSRTATRVYRAENVHASALKFEIDALELLKLNNAIEDEGWEIGAIYHSHVRSAPYPSQTDISFAANWPGVEWIIVGLASGQAPEVRSYVIDGPDVREVELQEHPS
jgi:proteasome lid subunit RPN8/RPN11